MATTLQHIVNAIRTPAILPPEKVNYGITDGLEPPYVNILDYTAEYERDTGGRALKNSTYRVVVMAKDVDEAEQIATAVDAVLDQQEVSPTTIASFQDSYQVGQVAEKLYQFAVDMAYSLQETIDPG